MVDNFIFWISDIINTSPPAEELNCALFSVVGANGYNYITLSFYEGEPTQNKFSFMPLQAQFFTHKNLKVSNSKTLIFRVKNLIEEALYSAGLKKYFRHKKIYIYYNKTKEYLFTI